MVTKDSLLEAWEISGDGERHCKVSRCGDDKVGELNQLG